MFQFHAHCHKNCRHEVTKVIDKQKLHNNPVNKDGKFELGCGLFWEEPGGGVRIVGGGGVSVSTASFWVGLVITLFSDLESLSVFVPAAAVTATATRGRWVRWGRGGGGIRCVRGERGRWGCHWSDTKRDRQRGFLIKATLWDSFDQRKGLFAPPGSSYNRDF